MSRLFQTVPLPVDKINPPKPEPLRNAHSMFIPPRFKEHRKTDPGPVNGKNHPQPERPKTHRSIDFPQGFRANGIMIPQLLSTGSSRCFPSPWVKTPPKHGKRSSA